MTLGPRATRAVSSLPWVVWGAVFVVGLLRVGPDWRADWDGALYLLLGRSLARGEGYRYLGGLFFVRPPALPWLYSLFGPGAPDFLALDRLTWAFACLSGLAATLATRPLLGPVLSLVPGLLLVFEPGARGLLDRTLAEFPSLAFTFLGLALLERWGRGESGQLRRAALGAACLAIACYFRSAAAVAVPGLAVLGLLRFGWRRPLVALLPFALVVTLMAPWVMWARWAAAQPRLAPPYQLLIHDYVTAALRAKPSDPRAPLLTPRQLAVRTLRNAGFVVRRLAQVTLRSSNAAACVVLVALAGAGVAAALQRGAGVLEWYALWALLLVCGYFVVDPRLMLPIVAPCASYVLAGVRSLAVRVAERSGKGTPATVAAWAAAVMAGVVLCNAATAEAFEMVPADRAVRTAAAAAWVAAHAPEDAAVLCKTAPVLSVLSGRVAYTYQFGFRPDLLERGFPPVALAVLDDDTPFDVRGLENRAERSFDLPTPAGAVRVLCLRPCRAR